jgi:hypothetical protein
MGAKGAGGASGATGYYYRQSGGRFCFGGKEVFEQSPIALGSGKQGKRTKESDEEGGAVLSRLKKTLAAVVTSALLLWSA